MRGRIARISGAALALALAAGEAQAAQIVDPAAARLAISTPAIVARDGELAALAAAGRATELAARLERIAHDATIPAISQEWLLDRGLHALARGTPTPAARSSVTRLAARRPLVYTRIDPDHGNRATPLYDTGATARFVLRQWDRAEARDAAAADIAAGRTAAVARFADAASGGAVRDGIADAFRAAPPAALAAQRAAVEDALAQGRRADALGLVLAERLADADLFGLVVDYADEPFALAAIPAAARTLEPGAALALLARASRRADIASAATLAIGALAPRDPAAQRFLLEAVAEPDIGASAAAALGRLGEPAVSAEIGRRLDVAADEGTRRRLVLALKLDGSPAARDALGRFAKGGAGSAPLRQEVRQWLER
jgi:hypothetical protein